MSQSHIFAYIAKEQYADTFGQALRNALSDEIGNVMHTVVVYDNKPEYVVLKLGATIPYGVDPNALMKVLIQDGIFKLFDLQGMFIVEREMSIHQNAPDIKIYVSEGTEPALAKAFKVDYFEQQLKSIQKQLETAEA